MKDDLQPIKRNKYILPVSQQHHYGLLIAWKLRQGLNKNVELKRLQDFVKWNYENEIIPHFKDEEEHLFPILSPTDKMYKMAIDEHLKMEKLFKNENHTLASIDNLQQELDEHIRFEERVLFKRIQEVATEAQLEKLEKVQFVNSKHLDYQDEFWK